MECSYWKLPLSTGVRGFGQRGQFIPDDTIDDIATRRRTPTRSGEIYDVVNVLEENNTR
jgi:hypothetical protein